MFAPVDYTPLASLWDQFLDAKLDAFYRSLSAYYISDGFVPALVRGSPLDVAEYVFLKLMCKYETHVAFLNGNILRFHSRFEDRISGVFTQMSPYSSAMYSAATRLEHDNHDEIEQVAGCYFKEWHGEPGDGEEWADTYPVSKIESGRLPDKTTAKVRFHSLPICFERDRFNIVKELPYWGRFAPHLGDIKFLIKNLGGRPICVSNDKLVGWEKILSGETHTLDVDLAQMLVTTAGVGRPTKIPAVIKAYKFIYPDGHSCGWKEAANRIGLELGEPISQQTLKRALAKIEDIASDVE